MSLVIPTRKITPSLSAVHPVDPSTKANGSCQGLDVNIVSFYDAFGVLGVPMLLTLLTCSAWTTWLIVAALAPNETANWLMSTGAYDNGQFWLISDKDPSLIIAGAAGLAVVDASTWSKRKFSNVSSKAFNLAMQVLVLLHLLESGAPEVLVLGYACLVAINSLSCALNIFYGKLSAVAEVLISSVFDWFVTVAYPILVLMYCYFTFNFDHAVFRTYLEKLPPSSFEHQARIFADPAQVALFRLSFDSLRIHTLLDLGLRVGMNLSFCYRCKRIGDVFISSQYRRRRISSSPHTVLPRTPDVQKPVPKAMATLFIAFSVAVWVLTFQAIADSRAKCSPYPECVVFTYRRKNGSGVCPCQIFIDVDRAPQTYEEWIHPVDIYLKVESLAASGELRSIQVVNHQLLQLPETLRKCKYLELIELIYTSTESVPYWLNEFTRLEFLHIEGKYGSQNLLTLPEELFDNMPRLSTIHFAVHEKLAALPRLQGVPNLQSVTLAWSSLRELPELEDVPRLNRLAIAITPLLEKMPDMTAQKNLVEFVITQPSHICCNGFSGGCILNDSSCVQDSIVGVPAATCLDEESFLGSSGTRAVFEKFAPTICAPLPPGFVPLDTMPTKKTSEMCDHRPFGQCHLPGGLDGMCYNVRMQALMCLPDSIYISLRKYQIQKGFACNPGLEKWLGCSE